LEVLDLRNLVHNSFILLGIASEDSILSQ
jgi:hypothetical protein